MTKTSAGNNVCNTVANGWNTSAFSCTVIQEPFVEIQISYEPTVLNKVTSGQNARIQNSQNTEAYSWNTIANSWNTVGIKAPTVEPRSQLM